MPIITILPDNRILEARTGETLHAVLAGDGLINAPCGGNGRCGKCRVLVDGVQVLACQTVVDRDIMLTLPAAVHTSDIHRHAGKSAAFDLGTTTVVCYLLDGDGAVRAQASGLNPQRAYGADVISRVQAAQNGKGEILTGLIRKAMADLLLQICCNTEELAQICVVGNPAMQQLFLGLSVENLAKIPFAPVLTEALCLPCGDYLPCCPNAQLQVIPDISGFVGADTVAGILATGLHKTGELTLLVDIGTNGELVLGNKNRMRTCATAAGPALEGASIEFGMHAQTGAIDHVWVEKGAFCCSVIGGTGARGICGSGLVDAVAAALDLGLINRRGKILTDDRRLYLTDSVYLTQEDVRQVQLAKGAICAGIRLLAQQMGIALGDISCVFLAGAFGSHINTDSACRIGLFPAELGSKITAAGNTAGAGGVLLAAKPALLETAQVITRKAEFLALAALPAFPRIFARAMELPEDWCSVAKTAGFSQVAAFDPAILQPRTDIRAMCAQDKCGAYGKNWTCPPHCGTLTECEEKMHRYRHGILVQTVGKLQKTIDTKAFRQTEQRHLEAFQFLCRAIWRQYPDALCLGSGGCRVCEKCAYPENCRFPEKAVSSMEGYGLFVTQVCRDVGLNYYHGEKTVTYTACILYG